MEVGGVGVLKRILRCMPEFMLKRKAGFDLTDVGRDAVFIRLMAATMRWYAAPSAKVSALVSGIKSDHFSTFAI